MAIHWQVKFKSLRADTLYTVNIYDSNYSGSPVQLTGAASPFVTQEDNNEDWFLPVRTQSGYVRIVDTGSVNWKSIIPATDKSRKVTLTDGNGSVRWQGYLQPQTFSGQLMQNIQEREFPVMCPLSVLQGVDVSTEAKGVVEMAYLLQYLLTQTGTSFNYIYFQGTDAIDWLQKKIDWENFIDVDDEGNRSAKYDCLTLLEEMCKFWGWTCRTHDNDLYFCSPDEQYSSGWMRIVEQDLVDISSAQYQTFSWSGIDISTDDDYATADNQVEILRGIRRASVIADINKQSDLLQVDFAEITEQMRTGTVETTTVGQTRYYLIQGLADGYDTNNYQVLLYWNQSVIRAKFTLRDECPLAEVNFKHNYDWQCRLAVFEGSTAADNYCVRFRTKHPISLDHGMITFNANTISVSNGWVTARLRIGNRYWNGSAWSTDARSTFEINFGNEQSQTTSSGKFFDTRQLNSPYPSYNGTGVPVDDAIGGILTFDILTVMTSQEAGAREVSLTSFSIGFVRHNNYGAYSERSKNEYKEETGSPFNDEKTVSTIFACDNGNTFGYGIVLNADSSYCTGVYYHYSGSGYAFRKPEANLLRRMIARGAYTKMKQVVNLRSTEVTVNPRTSCECIGMSGYPIAVSREWRDDLINLTIMED